MNFPWFLLYFHPLLFYVYIFNLHACWMWYLHSPFDIPTISPVFLVTTQGKTKYIGDQIIFFITREWKCFSPVWLNIRRRVGKWHQSSVPLIFRAFKNMTQLLDCTKVKCIWIQCESYKTVAYHLGQFYSVCEQE